WPWERMATFYVSRHLGKQQYLDWTKAESDAVASRLKAAPADLLGNWVNYGDLLMSLCHQRVKVDAKYLGNPDGVSITRMDLHGKSSFFYQFPADRRLQ